MKKCIGAVVLVGVIGLSGCTLYKQLKDDPGDVKADVLAATTDANMILSDCKAAIPWLKMYFPNAAAQLELASTIITTADDINKGIVAGTAVASGDASKLPGLATQVKAIISDVKGTTANPT